METSSTKRERAPLQRLLEASAIVTGSLDLDEVLRRVLPLAAEAAGAEGSSVILHDADSGTLFLDEIGELPLEAQVKLLRVLQEREIHRLGGSEAVRVDVRLVAATHRDLEADVQARRFREDLYFRVNVVPVRLPPLRERPEDVEPLAVHFLDAISRDLGRPPRTLLPESVERLQAHPWPGNVRELQNLMERLLVLGDEGTITPSELDEFLRSANRAHESCDSARVSAVAGSGGSLSLWDNEHRILVEALDRSGGNQSQAARMMGISREQMRTRMKRHGLLPRARTG